MSFQDFDNDVFHSENKHKVEISIDLNNENDTNKKNPSLSRYWNE